MDTADKIGTFLVGASTLVGGLLVGKTVVDLVVGPPKTRPKPREFDESLRLVASVVGLSVSIMQLPQAFLEAKKLIAAGTLPIHASP